MLSLKTQGLFFLLAYKIFQKASFSVNRSMINETEIEVEWDIEDISSSDDETIIHIKAGVHNTIKHSPQYRQLIEFMCMFNIPIPDLVLVLSETGIPIKVRNREETCNRWRSLCLEYLSRLENDKTVRPVLDATKNDFNNIISLIKKVPLYVLFFLDVYEQEIINNSSLFTLSPQVFTGKDVTLRSPGQIKDNKDGYSKLSIDAEGVPNEDFRKLYNDKSKHLFQDTSYPYKNRLRASYSYDSKQGIIESRQAELVENLTDNEMCSKQELEFKFIREEIKAQRNYQSQKESI